LLRRAIRFGNALGIDTNFTAHGAATIIETYKEAYPDLMKKKDQILQIFDAEEVQFRNTLVKGERELTEYLSRHDTIDGNTVFYFYETYGFPLELTEELSAKMNKKVVQIKDFEKAKISHQDLSRSAAAGKFAGGLADHSAETTKLHTATHLLNAALHRVLGSHINQKGSNITAERLRFDFNHPDKMTPEQITEVEDLVNDAIKADLPVSYHVTTVDGAKEEGAIGVFDDRYASDVKVYVVGDASAKSAGTGKIGDGPVFSKEICGGPHVAKTSMIGIFKIQKEESSSAGIRRIKAVVSGGPAEINVAQEA
jgi:alanyl-tRNA synthetase